MLNVNKIELSFIIPIYNVEKYLRECIESIMSQIDESCCEIILIDDGSSDSCGEICDEYGRIYNYISVIHKENGGLASARNAGLRVAKGKYVTFVDSDDRIASGCIADILIWITTTNADICFMQVSKFYEDGTKKDLGERIERKYVYEKPSVNVLQYLSTCPKYPGAAWGKIYRRDFLLYEKLEFPKDNRRSEDLGFMFDCIMRANKFDVLEMPYYEYRQGREGSITNRLTVEKDFWDLSKFITESIEKNILNGKMRNEKSYFAMSFVAYEYVMLLLNYSYQERNVKNKLIGYLKKHKWVLEYAKSRRVIVVRRAAKVIGVRGCAFLLKIYMNGWRKKK